MSETKRDANQVMHIVGTANASLCLRLLSMASRGGTNPASFSALRIYFIAPSRDPRGSSAVMDELRGLIVTFSFDGRDFVVHERSATSGQAQVLGITED